MASDRGWYFIAAVVMVLGLSHQFAHRQFRDPLDRSMTIAQQVTDQMTELANTATAAWDEDRADFETPRAAFIRAQAQWASTQAALACRSSRLARLQAQRMRIQVLDRMKRRVICSPQNFVLESPKAPRAAL